MPAALNFHLTKTTEGLLAFTQMNKEKDSVSLTQNEPNACLLVNIIPSHQRASCIAHHNNNINWKFLPYVIYTTVLLSACMSALCNLHWSTTISPTCETLRMRSQCFLRGFISVSECAHDAWSFDLISSIVIISFQFQAYSKSSLKY